MLAHFVERRLVLLQRLEAGPRLQRLRRQALERLLVLLELAVRRREARRFLLGGADRIRERLDPRVGSLELRDTLGRFPQDDR